MRTDEEQVAWYRGIRDEAEAQLKLINEGWRFKREIKTEPMTDITDEVAKREHQTVETMTRLIMMYEARRS